MQEMQEVVASEGSDSGSHCSCRELTRAGRPPLFCKDTILRNRQPTGIMQDVPRQEDARGSSALDVQVGGSHYKGMAIQPMEFALANSMGYCEATALKYVSRWKLKGGVADIEKAIHFLQLLKEYASKNPKQFGLKEDLSPL